MRTMKAAKYLALGAGIVLGLAQSADATPMRLAASVNGGADLIFTDAGTPNIISLASVVNGGVTINGSLSTSTIGATNILSSSALSVINNSGAPATITFAVSGMNFTGPSSFVTVSGSGTWVGNAPGTITMKWWDDPANVLGAATSSQTAQPGSLVGNFTSAAAVNPTSSFSFTSPLTPLATPDGALYSMTESFTLTLQAGASLTSRGQTEVKTFVPEPASLFVLGAGLVGIGLIRGRRKSG